MALTGLSLRQNLDLMLLALEQFGDELDLEIRGEGEIRDDRSPLKKERTLIRSNIRYPH
jgi:hypothetical protein